MHKILLKHTSLLLCLVFCLSLAACDNDVVNPGDVALVNGTPITLKQLQTAHDSMILAGDGPSRDTEALRKEYSAVLSELIAQELVAQELERRDISITPEELEEATIDLKRDYPPGGFEKMLLEESIDLEMWRESLFKRLSMEKFNTRILRPQVSITADEVENYYLAHEGDFRIPERVNFIQFSSLFRDQVNTAREQFQKERDLEAVQQRFENMTVRVVVMREDRLAPELVAALSALKPMQATPVLELNGEYLALILLSKEEAYLLPREEIYSRIEAILLEDKIQEAFQTWLHEALGKADIKVSVHLLPEEQTD
ncbi:MAG: SurA N-terminal domain-containing protein [Deltaproteobacteria bacterium]|jgi:parvulin-like peptidyl-prolyl isomerase|nr:SurA N-terminal domain-containing protein [Deltaproteobacteria bacterium]